MASVLGPVELFVPALRLPHRPANWVRALACSNLSSQPWPAK